MQNMVVRGRNLSLRPAAFFRRNSIYAAVVPLVVALTVLVVVPLVYLFVVSFFARNNEGVPELFVGLANYARALTDPRFYNSLFLTVEFTVFSVGIKLVLGLVTALILNRQFRGRTFLRGFLFVPWTIPAFVVAVMWYWMFAWIGVLNGILKAAGLTPINWLGPELAMTAIIVVNIWKGYPFYMMGILAGLQGIPRELYEAAMVDGAGAWDQFRKITLPSLKSVLATVVLLSTIWTFTDFASIYMLTHGGPSARTEVLSILVFNTGFGEFNIPLAAAMSITILPLFLVLIYFISRSMEL